MVLLLLHFMHMLHCYLFLVLIFVLLPALGTALCFGDVVSIYAFLPFSLLPSAFSPLLS